MLHSIITADQHLFYYLNGQWHNSFFDAVLPMMRNPYFWAPLYLFLLLFSVINYNLRGFWWSLFYFATFAITDYTSGTIIKHAVKRIRPCNDPAMAKVIHLLVPCGSGYSFPSNHAANHFAMATFMFFTLKPLFGKWTWVIFLWAAVIAYSQIYVGVHYPFDVLGGTLFGLIVGSLTANVFNKKIGLSG